MLNETGAETVVAAVRNLVAEVRLLCQSTQKRVNNKGSVMLFIHMLILIMLGLWDIVGG